MGIFRTTDSTQWDDVDGIIVNESAPSPNVTGVAANVGILIGTAERGLPGLYPIGSIGELHELFGKNKSMGINRSLVNKRMGSLKVIRVIATAAVQALKAFASTSVDRITFYAKQGKGAFGNNIQVKIEAGTSVGKKYTIQDTTIDGVMSVEVYDNVVITEIDAKAPFANSKLITAIVNSTAAEPSNIAFTALATGADGTIADTDYETALTHAEQEGAGNFVFLDSYNATRNTYVKTHVGLTQDKMGILSHAENDTVADIVTAVSSLRDTDGRLIMAANWVQTTIDGALVYTSPAAWLASILTQTAPSVDPAATKNAGYLAGAVGLKMALSRAQYIQFNDAGVCAFERDADIGIKPKSGITTQIINSSKVLILRRRMADYLTASAARFLKNYQNEVNSKSNRTAVKGGLVAFIAGLVRDGILPGDADVKTGKASLVDTESANTDSSIAAGKFIIIWKQRIFGSMRFIVLSAEIGESVVVTEQA